MKIRDEYETWVLQVQPDKVNKKPRYIHYNDPEGMTSMFIYSAEAPIKGAVEFMSYDAAWRYMRDYLVNLGYVMKPVRLTVKTVYTITA